MTAASNHVVFGRRGAGKSTLLLSALHTRNRESRPSVWIDMQVYARRDDDAVIADVLSDIVKQVSSFVGCNTAFTSSLATLTRPDLTEGLIRRELPALAPSAVPFRIDGPKSCSSSLTISTS